MAFRGRGRGRGGFGGGGFRAAKQEPFELYPEIEDLGTAEYSTRNLQLIKWYSNLQKYWNSSPYYYEGGSERTRNVQKPDVERLSDKNSQVTNAKPPLWHFIKLDTDHVPAELARGDKKEKLGSKKVRWNPESAGMHKLDLFEKLEQKHQGQEGKENKENEDQEEDDERNEEEAEEEFSDEGDYEQNEYFDDDEDDYNMADDNDDEPYF
ncbi:DNA-directed RNA polymerase III subunit RPC7-like [Olea europaea subsp. europaea]|uniref:DNA-directed RNA polymerase III subunit RPC7-like n=1 Tax=Olea europaea subsp. europaea TaxID=158383 RepID=A0A8S0RNE3_OLEEU|nr:DNA-directed RNA polymerase III subunit RPC7-like [Olea europaea subsp. europaea]